MERSVEHLDSDKLTKKFAKIGTLLKLASIGFAFLALYMMSI